MLRSWLKQLHRPHVVVYTTAGRTIAGALVAETRTELVLERARILTPDGPVRLDGSVGIPREQVEFWQQVNRPLDDPADERALREVGS